MKIDRLLGIVNILVNIDRITVKELSERFEVSKRTISRDLDTLNQAGIPIVTYSGIGGGVSIIEGYKYKKDVFSRKDIKNIFIGLSGLISINENKDLISLMAKIIPKEENNIFLESDYLIDLSSWFKESITKEKVKIFHENIKNKRCMSIEYISKNSRKKRVVHPYKLIFKQSYWYLYAFCEECNEFRLFKLNRIVSYKVLDKVFEHKYIEEFDIISTFESDLNFKSKFNSIYNIKLEYDAQNEFFLTEKFDGRLLVREYECKNGYIVFQTNDLERTADLVIGMNDKVKVIEPFELIELVKIKIKNISRFYKDDI